MDTTTAANALRTHAAWTVTIGVLVGVQFLMAGSALIAMGSAARSAAPATASAPPA